MTVQFFKWSSEDQIAQLTQFLVNNTPASSNQLTYLTGAHTFTTAPHIELAIYSSHPDPFNTTDIVVWILDWKHRIRLFTNSEFHLEQAELTDKAIEYAHGEQRKENNPECVYFKNEQDEQLYRKSLDVVEKVVTSFIEQTYKNDKRKQKAALNDTSHSPLKYVEMVVCDTNVLWLSALYKHYKVGMDMPHRKFLKQASKPIDTMPLPDHLERTSEITEDDLLLIQKSNKITFDFEYLKDCSRIGAGVRRKDTNQLVAWTLSHRDRKSPLIY